ncbi:MAG: alpha-amylase family glycosyl hydrolase, partial [Clostridia bacterium]|nr:alpha-amylase family glycosyl hydrolase [Clostridia bacterium]
KFTHGPNIHPYLHALNKEVLSKYDCMTVGEGPGMDVKNAIDYTAEEREELDTVFTFEHMNSDAFLQFLPRKFKLSRLKKIFAEYQYGLRDKGWNSLFVENHDQARSIPRFSGDFGDKRNEAAKMLATALYMQQGTPYCYQGQEIGMTNYPWKSLDEFQDVMVKYVLKIIDKYLPFLRGLVFKIMKIKGRDNARTPMQWNTSANAGFTTGTPWLPVNPDYTEINVEAAKNDPDSILNYFKELIRFRLGNQIIKHGTFKENYASSDEIYCYERWYEGERLMIICNFKNADVDFELPSDAAYVSAELKLHNYKEDRKLESMTLKPYEAMVFLMK